MQFFFNVTAPRDACRGARANPVLLLSQLSLIQEKKTYTWREKKKKFSDIIQILFFLGGGGGRRPPGLGGCFNSARVAATDSHSRFAGPNREPNAVPPIDLKTDARSRRGQHEPEQKAGGGLPEPAENKLPAQAVKVRLVKQNKTTEWTF